MSKILSATGLRSYRHCSGSCGQAAQILTKSSFWWRGLTRKNQTNEPRAVRRTSLRAASRAHEVLCTPNSTVGYAHITAANEKEGAALTRSLYQLDRDT